MQSLVLFSTLLFAPPGSTTAVLAPLPSFVMAGSEANASTTPKPGGLFAGGYGIASDKYWWSAYQIYISGGHPVTTGTTGIAQRVCSISTAKLWLSCWIIGMLGPGQTATSTNLALDAGGGIAFGPASWTHVFFWAGGQQSKVGSTNATQVQLTGGIRW